MIVGVVALRFQHVVYLSEWHNSHKHSQISSTNCDMYTGVFIINVIITVTPFHCRFLAIYRAAPPNTDTLPSVWSWDIQYSPDYISLFHNPLYKFVSIQKEHIEQQHTRSKVLKPRSHPSQVSTLDCSSLWSCYALALIFHTLSYEILL